MIDRCGLETLILWALIRPKLRPSFFIFAAVFLAGILQKAAHADDLAIYNLERVGKKSANKDWDELQFRVTVKNSGAKKNQVSASVTSQTSNTKIVKGKISFGDIAAKNRKKSKDLLILRQKKSKSFKQNQLKWGFNKTAEPKKGAENSVNKNQSPTITPTPVTTAVENGIYENKTNASDHENDSPSISPTALITPSPTSTPSNAQTGSKSEDSKGGADTQSSTIVASESNVVNESNNPPVISSNPPTQATEDSQYVYEVAASDVDNDALTYSLPVAPEGMTINSIGHINWTPTHAQVGSNDVTVKVEDGRGDSTTKTFTIVVKAVNHPPVLGQIGPKTTHTYERLAIQLSATDIDNDHLVYSFTPSTKNATIGREGPGLFYFRPVAAQVGQFVFTFTVSDGKLTDSETVTVTVLGPNRAPEISAIPDKSVQIGKTLAFSVIATDPDNDPLTYSYLPATANAVVNSTTGEFSFTPDSSQIGDLTLNFTVSDGVLSASAPVHITVREQTNAKPVITSQPVTIAAEETLYKYKVEATDADNDPLTFILENAPAGMTITAGGEISWVPTANQRPTQNVKILVSDNRGGTASQEFSIAITAANQPPVLLPVDPKKVTVGQTLSFKLSASDPEGKPLKFTQETSVPNSTLNSSTGNFSFTPAESQIGILNVTFKVSDGEKSDQTTVKIEVLRANRPPIIDSSPVTKGTEGSPYSYQVHATDPDGDQITYSVKDSPDGLSINNVSGLISWTPTQNQTGVRQVTVVAADAFGGSDSQQYSITVDSTTDVSPPVVTLTAPNKVLVSSSFTVTADVKDLSPISKVVFQVDGLTVSEVTSAPYVLNFSAPAEAGKEISVIVSATDSAGNVGTASKKILTTTDPDTSPPQVIKVLLPKSAAPGEKIKIGAIATDDRGVKSLSFGTGGVNFGEDFSEPYEVEFTVPSNAAVGSSIKIDVTALDFEGNSGSGSGSFKVVSLPDTEAPTGVTLSAPATALPGQTVQLSAIAADNIGIQSISFFADGVSFNTDLDSPYEVSFTVPEDAPLGSQIKFVATASDFAGNSKDSSPHYLEVIGKTKGVVVGEVFDDSLGQPIPNAHVSLISEDGKTLEPPVTVNTDGSGRYQLDASQGKATISVELTGYTKSIRAIDVLPEVVNIPLDSRLLPYANTVQINKLAGTEISISDNTKLTVPPGAFSDLNELRVVEVAGQALPYPLPFGWSPEFGVTVGPIGRDSNADLTLKAKLPVTPSAIPVAFDENKLQWIRVAGTVGGTGAESESTVVFRKTGTVLFVRPDVVPTAPNIPLLGEALTGVQSSTIPESSQFEISPSPEVLFLQPGSRSQVSALLNSPNAVISGVRVEVEFLEVYNRTDTSVLTPPLTNQDFILYHPASSQSGLNQTPSGLIGSFIASPSQFFNPAFLAEGKIRLRAYRAEGVNGSALVGSTGGTVTTAGGISMSIPEGALDGTTAVLVHSLDKGDPNFEGDSHYKFLGGFNLDLGGRTLQTPASLSLKPSVPPATGSQIVVVSPVSVEGKTVYELLGMASLSGDKLILNDGGTGLPFPGVKREGRILFLEMVNPVGFVFGALSSAQNISRPFVKIDSLPFVSLSTVYTLVSNLENSVVRASDLQNGMTAEASTLLSTKAQALKRDLTLGNRPPTVTSISPAPDSAGASQTTPITVRFSQEMDPQTITPTSFRVSSTAGNISGTVIVGPDAQSANFLPGKPLADSALITVQLLKTITDKYGRALNGGEPDGSFRSTFKTVDLTPPARPNPGDVSVNFTASDTLTYKGNLGSAEPGSLVNLKNSSTGETVSAIANPDGSFELSIKAKPGENVKIVYRDSSGNETDLGIKPPVVLVDLVVNPDSILFLSSADTKQITATKVFSDGTTAEAATSDLQFTSLNTGTANVSSSGLATPVADGDGSIKIKTGTAPFEIERTIAVNVRTQGELVVSGTVGAEGGRLESPDGLVVDIPEGALTNSENIVVTKIVLPAPIDQTVAGVPGKIFEIYKFSPELHFSATVRLEFPLTQSTLSNLDPDDSVIAWRTAESNPNFFTADHDVDEENEGESQFFTRESGRVIVDVSEFSYRFMMRIQQGSVIAGSAQSYLPIQKGDELIQKENVPATSVLLPVRVLTNNLAKKTDKGASYDFILDGVPTKYDSKSEKNRKNKYVVLHATNGGVALVVTPIFDGDDFSSYTVTLDREAFSERKKKDKYGDPERITKKVVDGITKSFSFTAHYSPVKLTYKGPNGEVVEQNFDLRELAGPNIKELSKKIDIPPGNKYLSGSIKYAVNSDIGGLTGQNAQIVTKLDDQFSAPFYVNSAGLINQLYAIDKQVAHVAGGLPGTSFGNQISVGIEIQHTGMPFELYSGPQIASTIALTDYLLSTFDQTLYRSNQNKRRKLSSVENAFVGYSRAATAIGSTEMVMTHFEQDRDYADTYGPQPDRVGACGTHSRKADPCEPFQKEAIFAALAYDFPGAIVSRGGDLKNLKINPGTNYNDPKTTLGRGGSGGNVSIRYGLTDADLPLTEFKAIPSSDVKQSYSTVENILIKENESATCGKIATAIVGKGTVSKDKDGFWELGDLIIRGTLDLTDSPKFSDENENQICRLRISGTLYLAPSGKIIGKIPVISGQPLKKGGVTLAIKAAGPVIVQGLIDLSGSDSTEGDVGLAGGNLFIESRATSPLQIPTIITEGGDIGVFPEAGDSPADETAGKITPSLQDKFPSLGKGGKGGNVTILGPKNGLIVFSGLKQLIPDLGVNNSPPLKCSYETNPRKTYKLLDNPGPNDPKIPSGLIYPVNFLPLSPGTKKVESTYFDPVNDQVSPSEPFSYCDRTPDFNALKGLATRFGRGIVTSGGLGASPRNSVLTYIRLNGASGGDGGDIKVGFPALETGAKSSGIFRFRDVAFITGQGAGFIKRLMPVAFEWHYPAQITPIVTNTGGLGGFGSYDRTVTPVGSSFFGTDYVISGLGGDGGAGGIAGSISIDGNAAVVPAPSAACSSKADKKRSIAGHNPDKTSDDDPYEPVPKNLPVEPVGRQITFCSELAQTGDVQAGDNTNLLTLYFANENYGSFTDRHLTDSPSFRLSEDCRRDQSDNHCLLGGSGGIPGGSNGSTRSPDTKLNFDRGGTAGSFGKLGAAGSLNMPSSLWDAMEGKVSPNDPPNVPPIIPRT